jgi:hypothetical protein
LSWLFETHSNGPHGTPKRGRLDNAPQIIDQRWVPARQSSRAATLAANPAFRQWPSVEILQAAADGRARQTRDLGDRLQSAPSRRPHLPGREHPPTAFIKLRADRLPTFANRLAINHADPRIATSQRQESRRPESNRHMPSDQEPIHL